MGYDMTIQHDGHLKGDKEYFRLNIWGMGRYRDAMHKLGMMYLSGWGVESHEWPKWDEAEAAKNEEAYEFLHARLTRPLLTRHPAGGTTIPSHKLGSNDGWYVTPEEIKSALTSYGGHSPEKVRAVLAASGIEDTDYWNEWIDYLRVASEHEGFRVY